MGKIENMQKQIEDYKKVRDHFIQRIEDLPRSVEKVRAELADAVLPLIRAYFERRFNDEQPNWAEFANTVTLKLFKAVFGEDVEERMRKL